MHVAICFWGLLRSLRFTIDSYHRYVLQPIVARNHTYEVFVHTYKLQQAYMNYRNKEKQVWINETDWHMLSPNYIYVEEQDRFDNDVSYPIYQAKGDPWDNNYASFKNHLRALNSLHHVTMAVESLCQPRPHATPKGTKCFDAVVFLRPDVEFLSPLPVHLLEDISLHKLYLPDFHRSCKGGEYNDRMAMGGLTAALTYGKKLKHAITYAQKHKLHSEKFTCAYLQEFKDLEIIEIPFRFRRVRSSGATQFRDQQEVQAPYILQQSNDTYTCKHPQSFYTWLLSVCRSLYLMFSQVHSTLDLLYNQCKPNRYMTPNDVYLLETNHCANAQSTSARASQTNRDISCRHKRAHTCIHDRDFARCSMFLVPHGCRYNAHS